MPIKPELPPQFDRKRLYAAVDWVFSNSGDATAYYEQDIHEAYSSTVYVEVAKRQGTLEIRVRRHGGMTDRELTGEAIRTFTNTEFSMSSPWGLPYLDVSREENDDD